MPECSVINWVKDGCWVDDMQQCLNIATPPFKTNIFVFFILNLKDGDESIKKIKIIVIPPSPRNLAFFLYV